MEQDLELLYECMETLADLDQDDLLMYLLDMTMAHPDTFLEVHHNNSVAFLQELREEEHNGYPLYPELHI